MVAPPLDLTETRNAIYRALADGRLQERQNDLNYDLSWSAVRAAQRGLGRNTADWHRRFEMGVLINWDTGTLPVGQPDGRIILLRPQLRRQDVLALFKTASVKLAKKLVAESVAENWYRERVKNWPAGQKPPSREDDEIAALEQFPTITTTQVRGLRNDFAPDAW